MDGLDKTRPTNIMNIIPGIYTFI